MSHEQLRNELKLLVQEREWAQFHTPANLAKSVAIEAGELLECFQWNDEFSTQDAVEELADVYTYCVLLADKLKVDLDAIALSKLTTTRAKYPINKSRGRSTKYDQL